MRIAGVPEEVERVESFDELRAGMIVWNTPCQECGKRHRGILMSLATAEIMIRGKLSETVVPSWAILPDPGCGDDAWFGESAISPTEVTAGVVYAVVEAPFKVEQDAASRTRKLART